MAIQFSGTNQGSFTSAGVDVFLPLPFGVTWMSVINETVAYAGGAGTGAQFYWQLGDAVGQGTIYTKTSATNALTIGQIAANSGFYLINNTINIPGALNNGSTGISAISNATPPVVTCGSTAGMVAGNIVRIYSTTGALQLQGYDFTIGTVGSSTTFPLAYAPTIVAGTTGSFRVIPYNPYFYPSYRLITNMGVSPSNTNWTVITLSVTQSYTVGQAVRLNIPVIFGSSQLNQVEATIMAIGEADSNSVLNTISVNVNFNGVTAFSFPLTASGAFTPATVVPVGEDTAIALNLGANILADATTNDGQFGILLKAGTGGPAGVTGNSIVWVAGTSWSNTTSVGVLP